MQSIYLVFSAVISLSNAHMSMQFPLARDSDAAGNQYAVWQSNEPMWPAAPQVCHGLPSKDVPSDNQFAAGDVITLQIAGTASHYGGHCSFWYSVDDIHFTKIADVRDCTLNADTTQVQIPDTLPVQCGTKCTFAWSWVPRVSGQCEVYSNCADISVSGLSGNTEANPQTINFQDIIDEQLCQRVDDNTHWTALFEPVKLQTIVPGPAPTVKPEDPTPPTTKAPAPSPTPKPVEPVDPSSGNIIVETIPGANSQWWYVLKVNNVAAGYTVSSVEVQNSNSVWDSCTADDTRGYRVYKCQPSQGSFQLPMSVRVSALVGDVVEMVVGDDAITSWDDSAQFDLGSNFDSNVVPSPPSPKPTEKPITDAPAPSPTEKPVVPPPPSPDSGDDNDNAITVMNTGTATNWWYAGTVENVNTGYLVEVFEIKGNGGDYFFCEVQGSYTKLVYGCSAPKEMVYPLSVRITGSDGQVYEAVDAITDMVTGSVFDLGFNIGNGVNPNPEPEPEPIPTPKPEPEPIPTPKPTEKPTSKPPTTKAPAPAPTVKPVDPNPPTTKAPAPSPTKKPVQPDDGVVDKEIIGYYASWQWYDRSGLAKPQNLDFSKVTIVNFAFFQPDADGNLYGTDSWADPNVLYGPYNYNPSDSSTSAPDYKCHWSGPNQKSCDHHHLDQGLIGLVHAAGARIFPSLGGWTLSDNFPGIAADPAKRANFVSQCVDLIKDYGFDGIDLDWEYPAYADHSGTPADTANFVLLLQELRTALNDYGVTTGQYYEITAAVGCGPSVIAGYDIPNTAPLLDQINLMTYDFFGGWSQVTGANAPLYYQGFPAGYEEWSVDGCVNNWRAGGAVDSQLNIGLPFYGRSFANADGPNKAHSGTDTVHWSEDEGVPQYFNIEAALDQMTVQRDPVSQTQMAWFPDGSGYLSFDDQQAICNKVEYALNEQLNGFIIWELSGDVRPDLSTPLLDEVNMKLDYPTTHVCA